jgi:hypothetical protein
MDNTFFAYLQQLELMAFFSGYPLLYAGTLFFAGNQPLKTGIKSSLVSMLPFAYALVGTLYLGLQLKNLFPDYSVENIKLAMAQPYLQLWGLLAILFWIPALAKKPLLSLLHSLVFFFLLLRDLIVHSFTGGDRLVIKNDMKVYTDSLLINVCAFIVVALVCLLYLRISRRKKSEQHL